MKRPFPSPMSTTTKKTKSDDDPPPPPPNEEDEPLGEDLVLEIMKRADARTLAAAACVSRRWRRMAEDERLWESVCTRHWASLGCSSDQLRSVVLALGGFRRLHSMYLLPLIEPGIRRRQLSMPSSSRAGLPARMGKDEVQLSLSLLSIGYFEKLGRNYKRDAGEGGSGGSG